MNRDLSWYAKMVCWWYITNSEPIRQGEIPACFLIKVRLTLHIFYTWTLLTSREKSSTIEVRTIFASAAVRLTLRLFNITSLLTFGRKCDIIKVEKCALSFAIVCLILLTFNAILLLTKASEYLLWHKKN